ATGRALRGGRPRKRQGGRPAGAVPLLLSMITSLPQLRRQQRLVEAGVGVRLQAPTATDLVVRPQPRLRVERVVLAALLLVARAAVGEGDDHVLALAPPQVARQRLA